MAFCTACGHQNENTSRFCNGCGQAMSAAPLTAPTSPHPSPYPQSAPSPVKAKDKTTATILAWLLGGLGVADFYLGNTGKGIAKLLTLGGFGIWALIDAIKLLTMSQQDFDQRYNNWQGTGVYPQPSYQPPPPAQQPPPQPVQQAQPEYREVLQDGRTPVATVRPMTPPEPAPVVPQNPPTFAPTPPQPVATPLTAQDDSLIVTGVNGQIELTGNRIKIMRKGAMGFLTQGLKGDKEILISQISSVQYRPAGDLANGYIQFAFLGGQESKAGLFDSAKDENSVMYNKKQQPEFDELKSRIDAIRDSFAMPVATPVTAPSQFDELEKLASLHQRGILTDAEFDAKKKEILGL